MKVLNQNISYEPKMSDFERILKTEPRERTNRPGMGGCSPRFDYYSNRRKHGALPDPMTYNSNTIATNKGGKSFLNQPNKSYSFGVSREQMQKIHIDMIQDPSAKKTANNPGPGEHELNFGWSLPKDTLLNKTGP